MGLYLIPWTKPKSRNTKVCFNNVKRQHKCGPAIISILLHLIVLVSLVYSINSLETSNHQLINQTFRSDEEFRKLKKMIATDLQRINKPAVKTIHSPDGDIIDCVLSHKQSAFDHPLLKGQKPLDPPERPKWHSQIGNLSDIFQLWSLSGESCPEGTIPIRRTTEQDMLRVSSLNRFGRKFIDPSNGHEHSIGYLDGGVYKGAKATLSVWAPHVEESQEFSLGQIWVLSGTFEKDLNSLEAGWQVYPQIYGDNRPRLFIYWTADAYQNTGCYNLKCPGFVQINKKIALGAAISPLSTYNGKQFDITLSIWKDPKGGNWWLDFGPGITLGYWPSSLFTHLKDNADKIEFGGEIVNKKSTGSHTSTQMGSGHYAEEGFGKASYVTDIQVLDSDSNVMVSPNLKFFVASPNCYTIQEENNKQYGKFLYYGGPGRNEKCS